MPLCQPSVINLNSMWHLGQLPCTLGLMVVVVHGSEREKGLGGWEEEERERLMMSTGF